MLLHLRPQFLLQETQDYGTYMHREPSVMIHTTKPDRRALRHLSCLRLDETSAGLLMRTARSSAKGMNFGAICSDWMDMCDPGGRVTRRSISRVS